MNLLLKKLLLISLGASSGPAAAQATYCPAEPMPELPGGGGIQAIAAAIGRRVIYPPRALQAEAQGRVFVTFVVLPSGQVREATVVRSFRPDCDAAVVQAVRQLPRFRPRPGRYGNVRYVVPITFSMAGARRHLPPIQSRDWGEASRQAMRGRNSTR